MRDPEGSGFHKQEERRGGGRHSVLKIAMQALQRGPAPEMARGGGLGCPVHSQEGSEGEMETPCACRCQVHPGAEEIQGAHTLQ